jgi:NAD(P)H-hydrate epimerase
MAGDDFYLSRDQVRELDRRAIHDFGVPGVVLMENAGRGCVELLMRLNPRRLPVIVLCGPGNNGGDGFVIARHLDNHGWTVNALFVADRVPARGDVLPNYGVALRTGLLISSDNSGSGLTPDPREDLLELLFEIDTRVWVVDALFGTGLSRSLAAPHDRIVNALHRAKIPVLAVDIPSGLDCDTGEPLGPCVRATHTATFVAQKKGFRNPNSRAWTGEVHVIDIGAPRVLIDEYRNGERPE